MSEGTVIVIHYGKGPEDTVFLGKNGSKLAWIVKHYGSKRNTTVSSAIAFLVRKGPLGWFELEREELGPWRLGGVRVNPSFF